MDQWINTMHEDTNEDDVERKSTWRAYDVSITKLVNNIIDEAFESNPELLESAKTRLLEKTKTELGLA